MIPVPQTIDDYTALIEAGTPFTLANIGGDGEMLTVTGWRGTNSDGKESTPEKQEALARCLLEPRYTFAGYNPGKAGTPKLEKAETWLRDHGINVPDRGRTTLDDPDYGKAAINIRWVHKEIIGHANTTGRLNGFLKALSKREWYHVGTNVPAFADLNTSVHVASNAGWHDMGGIKHVVEAAILTRPPDAGWPLLTFSLGYLTKVLIWRLTPDYPDVTMIDMGACFDPYCGVLNRSGYRRPEWPEMMARNLEGL